MGKKKNSYHRLKKSKKAVARRLYFRKKKIEKSNYENTEDVEQSPLASMPECSGNGDNSHEDCLPDLSCFFEDDDLPDLIVEAGNEPNSWSHLQGNRIFNPAYLIPKLLHLQSIHMQKCTAGTIHFRKEFRRGLSCQWTLKCNGCQKEFVIHNADPNDDKLNVAASWAAVTSGIGFSQFENVLTVLDVPVMCKNTFFRNEEKAEKIWEEHLQKSMQEAGMEEMKLAIDCGDVDSDGVPFITVVVDGGWSKRSYGHNYNASSGVAVIIGQRTGKLLFVGVRNKYCCICERVINKNVEVQPHLCYKNWDKCRPSTAMEQDIIVEGFKKSEEMHGLRYKHFVGDGDASVYARLMEKVSYGRSIHKIECANHCVRNYTGHLHQLASDKTFSVQNRKSLKSLIPRLTSAARGAVKYCAGKKESPEDLARDLINGPYHVLGDHRNCRDYFCPKDKSSEKSAILNDHHLMDQINSLVARLAAKAPRLIQDMTSNSAEHYMSLVAKYDGGKRINYSQRGSFQRRCNVAGLQFQKGHQWERSPFKQLTGKSPGETHKQLMYKKAASTSSTKRKLPCKDKEHAVKHRKIIMPPDEDYGPNCDQPEDEETLQRKCEEFSSKLQVNQAERERIIHETIGQAENEMWHEMRRVRLTASNFGVVCKRKDTTSCRNLVKQLLYKPQVMTASMEYGRRNEFVAVKEFEKYKGVHVKKCGLFVDLNYGFLGASPDGLVGEDAIVEVKCVPSARGIGLTEMARRNKNFFLEISSEHQLTLKKNHNYYYQIQGELNITQRTLCYLIVMSDLNEKLHIEEITRDCAFWEKEMVSKLHKFYVTCLLPEIVDPNIPKGKSIREPEHILNAQKKLLTKKNRDVQH